MGLSHWFADLMPFSRWCVFLLLFGRVSSAAAEADFQAGMAALQRGDYAEAYCVLKPLADRGDTQAQYNIGWLYANGHGLRVDTHKAIDWWKRAASKGYVDAQFALGMAYTTGEGIRPDKAEAVKWYLRAGKRGSEDAQDILRFLLSSQDEAVMRYAEELGGQPWLGIKRRVKGENVNFRAAPGVRTTVIANLSERAGVVEIGRRGQWVQVLVPESAQVGWVYEKLLD